MENKLLFFLVIIFITPKCNNSKIQNMRFNLDFYTSHHQFYISDKGAPQFNANNLWTEQAYIAKMALDERFIAVLTRSYGNIKAELVLSEEQPKVSMDERYDHIVEGSIESKSGLLQVLDCPTSSLIKNIKITPGLYRIRVYSLNLDSDYNDEDDANDRYKIEIWPEDSMRELEVFKQHPH